MTVEKNEKKKDRRKISLISDKMFINDVPNLVGLEQGPESPCWAGIASIHPHSCGRQNGPPNLGGTEELSGDNTRHQPAFYRDTAHTIISLIVIVIQHTQTSWT